MKKKTIIAISIVLVIGIAVGVATVFNRNHNTGNKGNTEIEETAGKIPEITAYYENEKVGQIYGYRQDVKEQYVRDVIIPVKPNRQTSIKIKTNGNDIDKITYEVENVEDHRLIDSGEVTGWKESEGVITCNYQTSAIMNAGTEYYLKFIIETKQQGEIKYYTRAMVTNKEFVAEQIKFAKRFSDYTLDKDKATELAKYIEPDADLPNDNFGTVTLKSNYGMLTWGELSPVKKGATQITAKEFCIKDSGEAGTYTLNYQVECTNAQGTKERYHINETITVWSYSGEEYVLGYEREMKQIWQPDKNNVGNSFIDLGIQSQKDIEHVESINGNYMAFAINGDVYVIDIVSKKVMTVYQLSAQHLSLMDRTKAKVISIDDNGNLDYMIYGYSPSDNHSGKNGISIMEYRLNDNKSVEKAFVPTLGSAQILEQQLSELCYIGDGAAYIMLDNTIYFANLKTKEWGVLVSDLANGACVISDDGTTIAYNTSGQSYDTESMTVVNLADGSKKTIPVDNGNAITVCGYTGANLIYGVGNVNDISKYRFFPIETLKIVDSQLKEVKSYSQKNVYIMGVDITETIINIKRWKKGKAIEDDQLLDNTEEKLVIAKSSYYNDDRKKKELALSFTNNLDAGLKLKVEKQGNIVFDGASEVKTEFKENQNERYYAYGYGKLQGIYTDKNAAVTAARNACGLVTNEKGKKIWTFEENYN